MTNQDKARRAADFGEYQHDGQESAESAANCVRSPRKDYIYFGGGSTAERLVSARKNYTRALAWIRRNPDAWAYITRRFVELGRRGRRFAMQAILEEVRDRRTEFTPTDGKRFTISNSYRGVFTRLLARKYPQYAEFVTFKRGPLDTIMEEHANG